MKFQSYQATPGLAQYPAAERFGDVGGAHPGVTEVRLRLMTKTSTTVMRLDDRLRVAASPAPMPRATANAPIRPIYLAYPMVVPP